VRYTTINIQGNLISEEILQKIESGDAPGQQATDFGFEPGSNIRSEIEYAWSRIKLDWKHFSDKSQNLPVSDPYGTTLSRKWMEHFLSSIGFDLSKTKSGLQGDNNQSYTISHVADNLSQLPVHIVGFIEPGNPDKNTLDIKTSGGTSRLSPHATVQEYLNVTEHVYGIAANGLFLRLIRDSGRLIKLTYVEFDLKRMLDEDKYSEFTLLYRLLHASRFPKTPAEADQCFLEKYYQDSIETGNRIRDGLSLAVKESLVALGNGLLNQPENEHLREAYQNGQLTAYEFNHQLLRLIYRMLFLIVTEERDLIYDSSNQSEEQKRNREIYYRYYSLARLRKLSENRYLFETQFTDLWQGLMQTFSFFEPGNKGIKLGIQPLGGELFRPSAIRHIRESLLNNRVLLECIRSLNEFEDAKKNRVLINFRALDVEELGSIYEGLLELSPVINTDGHRYEFTYEKGSERSSSGSHYTPEDLVKPLIQHSLEYLIEDRVQPYYKGKITAETAIQSLLSLKVADVACGSGHILLSAARRIAHEVARIESGEQQPNPLSFRKALKQVIRHCIYGVDKNPLAVELCKVALWLESHNPGEPLNFLDHHIKCGDAIVGLAHRSELENGIADEAFKTLPGDDKDIAAAFRNRNKQERKQKTQLGMFDAAVAEEVNAVIEKFNLFKNLPENTTEEVARKEKEYRHFEQSVERMRLKQLADAQVAQFFIPKTEATKAYLMTDAEHRGFLRNVNKGMGPLQSQKLAYVETLLPQYRFFHWFIEFPEVFNDGGFDCIIGNPPFLGGQKLSGSFGDAYLEYIKYQFAPIGAVDLVTYFFRRIFSIIKPKGFLSLISTNTIAQGRAREDGLDVIVRQGGSINFAIKSTKWPGQAAVEVALVTITKQPWKGKCYLGNKEVKTITPYLDDAEALGNPYPLKQNEGKSFQGSIVLGKGFVLEPEEAKALIEKDPRNKDVLFPYLNGDDLNNNPDQSPSRWVINFFDWPEEKAKTYPDCYEIVERLVKPERLKMKGDRGAEFWWQFLRSRKELYQTIAPLERVLVICRVTKYVKCFISISKVVFSDATNVFYSLPIAYLENSIHEHWAWKVSSTMGGSTLRYSPSDCFETFPFPNCTEHKKEQVEYIGNAYYDHRRQLMLGMQLGLTKTYNAFHSEQITVNNEKWAALLGELESGKHLHEVDIAAYGFDKESLNLIKHFQKGEPTITLRDAVQGIEQLRALHVQMDEAVLLDAYGWNDIALRHAFYEVDYLPENDRVRFTIHPDARKEVLKRLLQLNHKIHEEEVKAGLWDKKKTTAKKMKTKTNPSEVNEPQAGYGTLFENEQ
jgi:type I restriction-modification system DNA methylase subunit